MLSWDAVRRSKGGRRGRRDKRDASTHDAPSAHVEGKLAMPLASVADMELVMEAREVLKESARRDMRTAQDMLRELVS